MGDVEHTYQVRTGGYLSVCVRATEFRIRFNTLNLSVKMEVFLNILI